MVVCFVMIEEMVVRCLSSLFGLASVCFSQKFAKGGDCWIIVCWLHFCYNKYSCTMLDMMFQHRGTVQYALFVWLVFRKLYLFKETTLFSLVHQVTYFRPESAERFVPKV